MGRNREAYEEMSVDPRAVMRVLQAIHAANKYRVKEFLDDLSGITAEISRRPSRPRAAMQQTWRRWLTGKSLPPLREASAIVWRARDRHWIERLNSGDLGVAKQLTKIALRSRSPVKLDRAKPLGVHQPRSQAEKNDWLTRLSFVEPAVRHLFVELVKCAKSAPMSRLSEPADGVRILFRAAMHEFACRTVESFGHRGSSAEARRSLLDANAEWPAVLRATADDLRALLYDAAIKVEQGEDVKEATGLARRRLFVHPESMEFRQRKKRRPRMGAVTEIAVAPRRSSMRISDAANAALDGS